MNVLYITENLLANSVYKSQVEALCSQHAQTEGVNVKLLSLCKNSDYTSDYKSADFEITKKRRTPLFVIPILNKLHSIYHNCNDLFEWADVIHCRGHGPSLFAVNYFKYNKVEKKPIISDMRASLYEELLHSDSLFGKISSRFVRHAEYEIFLGCDYFFFVSEKLREYFNERYNFDFSKTHIFPTFVNKSIFFPIGESRLGDLGIDGKKVYVYCGGVSFWQNLNKIIVAYANSTSESDNHHLLLVVTDPDYVNKLMNDLSVDRSDITVLSSDYEDVAKYIRGCFAGLLIRDDNVINNVASPTKVFEYLSCGVPVVRDVKLFGTDSVSIRPEDLSAMSVSEASILQLELYREFSS